MKSVVRSQSYPFFGVVFLYSIFFCAALGLAPRMAYCQDPPFTQYGLPGQVLPVDCDQGYHVRAGMYGQGPEGGQVPYLIVVAKGEGGLTVLQNIPDASYHMERIPDAIPWNSDQQGRAFDVRFLDLEPIQPDGSFGDTVDDHLFVAVGDHPVLEFHSAQDRLYKIEQSGGSYTFTEVVEAHAVLPQEGGAPHFSHTVISTESLDTEGNLYLVLAGGFYGDKQAPTRPMTKT